MTKKAKRSMDSASHSLQRTYRRISSMKPSTLVVGIIAIGFCAFFFGGGIYNLLQEPTIVFPYGPGQFSFIYPMRLNEQVVLESAFVMILYGFGVGGLLLTYQSTRYSHNSRQAYFMLIVGLILLIVAVLGIEIGLSLKFASRTTQAS